MIWHIFKKDLKILWPFALVVAALHSATLVLAVIGGITGNPRNPAVVILLRNLVLAGPLASGLLITAAVHLDAIPGLRQDWLIRPIRRQDLMLAKLLFAALAVQGPILIANAAAFMIGGFSPLSSLNNAAQHSLVQMLAINVPFVALASITRNLLELVSGAVALGCIYVIAEAFPRNTAVFDVEPVVRSGLGWTLYLSAAAVMFLGAGLVLWFQYFSRRTKRSWFLAGCVTVCFVLTWFLPWRFVFSMQRLLRKDPVSSEAITLKFDPEAGRFHSPSGGLNTEDARALLLREAGVTVTVPVPVYLPVSVAGLPPDSAIQMDHAVVHITVDGRVEELQEQPWNTRREGSAVSSSIVYPKIPIPATIYDRIKDRPVRVEIDNWLTLVRVATTQTLPALGGAQDTADGGRCQTSVNDQQTAVQYVCSGGAPAPCFHSFLEHLPGNERNPDRFACGPYASIAGLVQNVLFPARLNPPIVNLPFRDSAGLAHFPVDGSKLRDSRAVLQFYRAQDHFMRTLVIPEVRLADWEAGASGT